VSFLKRLFGETDAVEDARRRAGAEVTEVRAEGYEGPPGWGKPEITQTDDEFVLTLNAPGLDPQSVRSEVDGDALVLNASGTSNEGVQVILDERLVIEGADPSQADVSYEEDKLVVRLPKSDVHPEQSGP
jgi:HSP20 family molecular chaperone IbpA